MHDIKIIRDQLRQEVERRFNDGASGTELNHLVADTSDKLINILFSREEHPGVALVALGGYGRKEMAPYSDIDLMVLHQDLNEDVVKGFVERIVYPLWDIGIETTGVSRTIDDCFRVAGEDVRSLTAMMDGRLLAGNESLFEEFRDSIKRHFSKRRNRNRYYQRKVSEHQSRLKRYGDSVFVSEPHIKEGEGGIRCYQTANWIGRVMWGARTIDDLERLEILDPKSVADWKRALDFLWRLRFGLHLTEGRRHDRLGFPQQETLARLMGYLDKNPESGLEDFMHDYYRYAYYIHRATERLIGFYLKRSPLRRMKDHFFSRRLDRYISRKGDSIHIKPEAVRTDPRIVFKGWKIAHKLKLPLTTETKQAVRLASETWDDISISPEIAETFREIIKDPIGLDKLLLELHETGVLFKLIPEFETLHHKVKFDAYHLYTVDIHTIFLIRELSELFSGENKKKFPHFSKTAKRVERPDLLVIACLLHDIGKGYEREERHDTYGAAIAKEIVGRLGFSEEDQEAVDFLVRYHLVLPQLAFCRDIDDPLMIENLANSVKTTDDLRRLYLLTFADIRATGPDVWSDWKGELLTKLYQRTREFLADRGDTARNIEDALSRKEKSMKKLLLGEDHDQAIEWIHGMPNRYILNTSTEELASHYLAHMETEKDDRPLKLLVKPFETYHELTIVTKDHPGLFAHLCSVFFRNKINILEAQLYTGKDGNVVDIFRVVSSLDTTIENDFDWAHLEVDMKQAASKDPQQYLKSDSSTDGIRRRRLPIEKSVQIDNDVSVDHTVLEIHSKDQIGLLYHLAEWLYQHHYDISMAKAITHAGNVIDIFYIRTIDGNKVESKEELTNMKRGLVECLEE